MDAPAVEFANYCYSYPDGVEALRDVNLRIEHGSKVALIGPNGAGKSTLLLAMNLFVRGRGVLRIDGLEADRRNQKEIRSRLGLVLQDPEEQLFMPTVFDDVAFGPLNLGLTPEEVTRRTQRALATVGLTGLERRSPHHLSAGQKRKAAIATILSMDPKIITMDEPDTSLDPRSRNALIDLLAGLDQTLIIATCSMNFAARVCDRAVLVDEGAIIAQGPAREIMMNEPLMIQHGLETPTRWRSE